jgi:Ca2+-binding RTX toxin-like protein
VRVTDTTRPTIVAPANRTISVCTGANIGTATATDRCGGTTITNNAPAKFPLGPTTVTWTARDAAGNTASATQIVTAVLGDDASCCPNGTRVIVGTAGSDRLTGTAGSDCILGRGGDDIIDGGGGNDFISGGAGRDTITGGFGNDTIFGGADDDTIDSGPGDDFIDGGQGTDVCAGSLGTNVIVNCEVQSGG